MLVYILFLLFRQNKKVVSLRKFDLMVLIITNFAPKSNRKNGFLNKIKNI